MPKARPVICYETGDRFESLSAAASAIGCTLSNMGNAVRRGHAAGGFHWYLADQARPDANCFRGRPGRPGRAVVCVETGARYTSVAAAAASCDVARCCISRAATKGLSSGGYHWRYDD